MRNIVSFDMIALSNHRDIWPISARIGLRALQNFNKPIYYTFKAISTIFDIYKGLKKAYCDNRKNWATMNNKLTLNIVLNIFSFG